MKVTILSKSRVKYAGRYLTPDQTYADIDDTTAQQLIDSGDAKLAADEINGASVENAEKASKTPKFDPKKEGYKGEAVLTAKQKKELEEKGETTNDKGEKITKDDLPVNTPPEAPADPGPKVQTEVLDENGNPLSEEEIKAREAALANNPGGEKLPTAEEATQSGQTVPPQS